MRATPHAPHLPYPSRHEGNEIICVNPVGAGYTLDPHPGRDVVTEPAPTNGLSFFLFATHELGHALGLGHDPTGDEAPGSPWFIATMNPAYPGGGLVGQKNIIELHWTLVRPA